MWLRRRRRRRRCHFFLLCPPYGERQEAASLSHILEMLSISPSLRPPKLASGQNGGPLFPPLLHFFSHTLFPFFIHIYKRGKERRRFSTPRKSPLFFFPSPLPLPEYLSFPSLSTLLLLLLFPRSNFSLHKLDA